MDIACKIINLEQIVIIEAKDERIIQNDVLYVIKMIDYIKDLPRVEMMVLEKKKIEVLNKADEKDLFITYLRTRDKILRTYLVYRNIGLV